MEKLKELMAEYGFKMHYPTNPKKMKTINLLETRYLAENPVKYLEELFTMGVQIKINNKEKAIEALRMSDISHNYPECLFYDTDVAFYISAKKQIFIYLKIGIMKGMTMR